MRAVLSEETVAPHDSVGRPQRDQDQGCIGDELNLRLEPLDGHVVDEVAAGLEVGGGEDELEPDVQEQTDAVLEDLGQDQVRMDDRVEVALDPP